MPSNGVPGAWPNEEITWVPLDWVCWTGWEAPKVPVDIVVDCDPAWDALGVADDPVVD